MHAVGYDLAQIWHDVCEIIKKELTEVSYKTWIEPIKPVSINADTLNLTIHSEFEKGIIDKKYTQLIKTALKIVTSKTFQINTAVSSHTNTGEDDIEHETVVKYDFTPNPLYKFENFVTEQSNILAYKAAFNIADKNADKFNSLYIYGDAGLGKTHLLHAIAAYTLEHNPLCSVLYISIDEFINDLIASIKYDNNKAFIEKYISLDLLLIDNFQFIAGKERTQHEFFNMYNTLSARSKSVVIASRENPQSLEFFNGNLSSSIDIGLICQISTPDYETRISIMKKFAEIENINITDEIAEYAAKEVVPNVRELKNAFNRIMAFSTLLDKEINLENAKSALQYS